MESHQVEIGCSKENLETVVKGLNAKTRLRVMKNIQKIRHITMPRPKTVEQFIADQMSRNASMPSEKLA